MSDSEKDKVMVRSLLDLRSRVVALHVESFARHDDFARSIKVCLMWVVGHMGAGAKWLVYT